MAAIPRQFRFYGINSEQNYDGYKNENGNISYNALVNGDLFQLEPAKPACQIGIQTLPGTKFYLNQGNNPIIVGITGIYELNTENIGINITSLRFDGQSIRNISAENGAYLIIDIIYNEG